MTSSAARRTSPDHEETSWPRGIPYIIGNEGCERFSFYGMRSILFVYIVDLYTQSGHFGGGIDDLATAHYHLFTAGVYALPMIGAIIADRLLGKYRTIIYLSLVYCLGHAVLAVTEGSIYGLWAGLGLIAVGSGGIKPCVSAHVGDQFGRGNWFRLRSVYQIFYFIINLGAMISMLLIPWLLDRYGASVAFALPGILMFIATAAFWAGRNVFIHVPAQPAGRLGMLDTLSSVALFMSVGHLFFTGAAGVEVVAAATLGFLALGVLLFAWRQRISPDDGFLTVMLYSIGRFLKARAGERRSFFAPAVERFGRETAEGPIAVLKIGSVFLLVSVFWALFDQTGSSWVRQAQMMDPRIWGDIEALPSQIQALNPFLVMVLIPLANLAVFPAVERLGIRATPLRRMTAGMLIASVSFVVVALIQIRIEASPAQSVNVAWQLIPYLIITFSEILVSITGLEFAYSQAPRRMKSTIMGFWLLAVALGNVLVSLLAGLARLPLIDFFWLFAVLMLLSGVLFGIRAYFYEEQDFVQQ